MNLDEYYKPLDQLMRGKQDKTLSPSVRVDDAGSNIPQEDYSKMSYNTGDLTKDEFYFPIEDYMVDRFGTHLRNGSRQEVVDKYLNNMRGFSGGNTVRTLNEMSYLSSLEDQETSKAGKAYAIFENLPNIYSDKATWSDTIGGSIDYARGAILDPVNVIGGLLGKTLVSGGSKSAAIVAQIGARKAYEKTITRSLARGLNQNVASKLGERAAARVISGAHKKLQSDIAKRAAWRNETVFATKNNLLGKIATKGNLAESSIMASVDSIAAGATDWAWQTGLFRTDNLEERSLRQTGIVALGTLIGAGAVTTLTNGLAQAKRASLRGGSDIVGPDILDHKKARSGARLSAIGARMNKVAQGTSKGRPGVAGNWANDIKAGKELSDLDQQFWLDMVLGNEELGIKGLTQTLVDQDFVYVPKDEHDKITNFLGDIIEQADPQDFKQFIKEFKDNNGNPLKQISKLTQKEFAQTFKKRVSDASKITNMVKQASDQLGVDELSLTPKDLLKWLNQDETSGFAKKIEGKVSNITGRVIPRVQNRLIRLLVANMATTQLNLLGWSAASTMDTASDIVTGALMMPRDFIKDGSLTTLRRGVNKLRYKLANTLDANTTYDEFRKYIEARPKALRELTTVIAGGVENTDKLYRTLDLDAPITSMRWDKLVDFIQDTQLVRAQDSYTKSIEFMSSLQAGIKREYGVGYREFFENPEYWKIMGTERFQKIEQRAVYDALDNIYSRKFGDRGGALSEVADIIEKTRNIPGIGVMMPFGRFFNNTVAFMSDYSGMSLAMRTLALNPNSSELTSKLIGRTAVGWGLILAMVPRELEFIEQGLAWDEQTQLGDVTGAITTEKHNFPYAFFKAAARAIAHRVVRGEELPDSFMPDVSRTLGLESFTREVTDAFGEGGEGFWTLINGDEAALDVIGGMLGKIGAQAVGSATRAAEPINSALGLMKGESRIVKDRRQNNAVLNNMTRYTDNLIGSLFPDEVLSNEQRYIATRGAIRPQDSKFISPVREVKTTNMSRLANAVGIPEWDSLITQVGKDLPQASNRYAKLYNKINENAAGSLLADEMFKKGNLERKKELAKDLMRRNKKFVMNVLQADISGTDARYALQIAIKNKHSSRDIDRSMKDVGIDKNLDELSLEELMLLETHLSVRKYLLRHRP